MKQLAALAMICGTLAAGHAAFAQEVRYDKVADLRNDLSRTEGNALMYWVDGVSDFGGAEYPDVKFSTLMQDHVNGMIICKDLALPSETPRGFACEEGRDEPALPLPGKSQPTADVIKVILNRLAKDPAVQAASKANHVRDCQWFVNGVTPRGVVYISATCHSAPSIAKDEGFVTRAAYLKASLKDLGPSHSSRLSDLKVKFDLSSLKTFLLK